MPEWKDILAAVTTLVATFLGAWAAFALENLRRKREENEKNVGSANRAIHTIFSMWNVLEQFRKESLESWRGRHDAWLNLAAHPAPPIGDFKFRADDLQFLLQTSRADIFATLLLEEQRFHLAMDLIRARSNLILERVFPAMASAGFGVGQAVDQAKVEQAIGIDTTHKLKQLTAAIYTNVDEDLISLRSACDKLSQTMKKDFPKQKLIGVEFQADKIPNRAVKKDAQ
jgi:hypothetical protein